MRRPRQASPASFAFFTSDPIRPPASRQGASGRRARRDRAAPLDLLAQPPAQLVGVRIELVDSNPGDGAERPKLPRRSWRILEPVEVARVAKAFSDDQGRVVVLTLVLTGIRRSELQALRSRDVDLVEGTPWVRASKSEDERLDAAEALT